MGFVFHEQLKFGVFSYFKLSEWIDQIITTFGIEQRLSKV